MSSQPPTMSEEQPTPPTAQALAEEVATKLADQPAGPFFRESAKLILTPVLAKLVGENERLSEHRTQLIFTRNKALADQHDEWVRQLQADLATARAENEQNAADLAHFTAVNQRIGDENAAKQDVIDRLTHLTIPAKEKETAIARAEAAELREKLGPALASADCEIVVLREKVEGLTKKQPINTHVRLFDLVRHQRSELHQAELITDEEYFWLCAAAKMAHDPKGGSPSPRRLED